jgi:hypothetical protein
MAVPARSEADERSINGMLALYRSPTTAHYRGENLGSLKDVFIAKAANEQEFVEPEPTDPPPPDPETTRRWAKLLDGRVYLMRKAATSDREATFRTGPRTPGAERRLASLQNAGSDEL